MDNNKLEKEAGREDSPMALENDEAMRLAKREDWLSKYNRTEDDVFKLPNGREFICMEGEVREGDMLLPEELSLK